MKVLLTILMLCAYCSLDAAAPQSSSETKVLADRIEKIEHQLADQVKRVSTLDDYQFGKIVRCHDRIRDCEMRMHDGLTRLRHLEEFKAKMFRYSRNSMRMVAAGCLVAGGAYTYKVFSERNCG